MVQTLLFFLASNICNTTASKAIVQALDALLLLMTHQSSYCKVQFEEALNTPNPKEGLERLIDPALGEDYPIDSILKVRPRTN